MVSHIPVMSRTPVNYVSETKAESRKKQPHMSATLTVGPKNIPIKPPEACKTNIILVATIGILLK